LFGYSSQPACPQVYVVVAVYVACGAFP